MKPEQLNPADTADAAVAEHQLVTDLVAAWQALPEAARCEDNLSGFLSDFKRQRKIEVPNLVERDFYAAIGIKRATVETHRSIIRCLHAGLIYEGRHGSPPPARMTGIEMIEAKI